MSFIKYEKSNNNRANGNIRPTLTIGKNSIFINKRACILFDDYLNGKNYCTLHYNPDNDNIGLQTTSNSESGGALKMTKTKHGITISSQGFVSKFGINFNGGGDRKRYLLKECNSEYFNGMLVVPKNV